MQNRPRRYNRRSIRLRGYDYSLAGLYFVTICVNQRIPLFGRIQGDEVGLTDGGMMISRTWAEIPAALPGVDIDRFVVMPNHFHGIVLLTWGPTGLGIAPDAWQCGDRPRCHGPHIWDVLRWFKLATGNRYRAGAHLSGWPPYSVRLWQRNYYEHIIRNGEPLARIRKYITENPSRWHLDRENPDRSADDPFDLWLDSLSDEQEMADECI
jgi:putative transposase